MDHLGLSFGHRLQRGIDVGDLKLGGQSGGALPVKVGNSDDFGKRQTAQRPGMICADIPRAHQSDFDTLVRLQDFFPYCAEGARCEDLAAASRAKLRARPE